VPGRYLTAAARLVRAAREDVAAVFARDPAARSTVEVLLCYPGLHAVWIHRLAHQLHRRRWFLVARLLSHAARGLTGIEIHPGARVGRRLVIDHGMGVVIGETAEVGHDVLLYQGVTLGGTSLEAKKRHPTDGSRVVLGAGAKVLGPIDIGDGARVGAGSVVTRAVPPGVTVVGVPAHPLRGRPSTADMPNLQHADLPDPLVEALRTLVRRVGALEAELDALRGTQRRHRTDEQDAVEALLHGGAGI